MFASLFEQLVEAVGLSSVIAKGAVVRALKRADVDPGTLTRGDLRKALPQLEALLEIYLPAEEIVVRREALYRLARTSSAVPKQ